MTGQWTPIDPTGGNFLPITGGSMQGNINMSGNTLTNMAAVPAMPNGAAPAQWVLNQIASVSLYQGTWDADTNTPDLTQLSTHVNAYTWIALTTAVGGVVIGAAIPGLQGQTVFNGDTIIYSTAQGAFSSIHAGGISLPEADARYVQLAGSQMSGALLLNANASQPLQATTLQQLDAAVANTVTPDAPADGQGYLRVGVGANRWVPGLPLAGGILTGALTLAGPGASGNNAVTVTQLNSAITGVSAGLMPIAGGTFTGAVILNGNATANLNPVPLQQLNNMLGAYAPLQNPAFTGVPTAPTATPATTNTTQIATTAFTQAALANYLPLSGGTLTGTLNVNTFLNVGTLNHITPSTAAIVAEEDAMSTIYGYCGQNSGGSGVYIARTDSTITAFAIFFSTNNLVGSITNQGSSTAFNETSDGRLKTNINPVADSGAIVDALNPVTFNWTIDPEGTRVSHGFIAQDAESVYPDAVTAGRGNPGDQNFIPYGMDNSKIVPIAIAELKSLRSRVAALEARA